MKCSQLVEIYSQDYAFALVRHFFFDHAEFLRYSMLQNSRYEPLAQLSKKIKGEIKYHLLHADTWMQKLSNGTEESKARMQSAVNEAFPYALGVFEPSDHDKELKEMGAFEGETALREQWLETVFPIVRKAGLTLPEADDVEPKFGGRNGYHTEFLQPLLNEMTEVLRSEPEASW
jgi:ring-1,2-phenylacetyl-CoA epoxidase subunit PaaC